MFFSVYTLMVKDATLEFRNKYLIGGLLLYVVSTVYLIYYFLGSQNGLADIQSKTWITLFWIVILFSTLQAIMKSYQLESKEQFLYYYTLIDPKHFIIAKMLYNFIFIIFLTLICFAAFAVFIGNPVKSYGVFFIAILLGASAYSFLFTMITGIALKADNNGALAAILGFPIVLPLIIYMGKVTREAFDAGVSDNFTINLIILGSFNIILFTLSTILFPVIWRE